MGKLVVFDFLFYFWAFGFISRIWDRKNVFYGFLDARNHAQPLCNYLKKSVWDPKHEKLSQKSSFWRLVSVS